MMKKYILIFATIFILVVSVSVVLASIIVPPPAPQSDPPGVKISEEERMHSEHVKTCEEWYKQQLEQCSKLPGYNPITGTNERARCIKQVQNALQGCFRRCEEMRNPPPLILPNGNSPGQNK